MLFELLRLMHFFLSGIIQVDSDALSLYCYHIFPCKKGSWEHLKTWNNLMHVFEPYILLHC